MYNKRQMADLNKIKKLRKLDEYRDRGYQVKYHKLDDPIEEIELSLIFAEHTEKMMMIERIKKWDDDGARGSGIYSPDCYKIRNISNANDISFDELKKIYDDYEKTAQHVAHEVEFHKQMIMMGSMLVGVGDISKEIDDKNFYPFCFGTKAYWDRLSKEKQS
jgi:hypothetical protein